MLFLDQFRLSHSRRGQNGIASDVNFTITPSLTFAKSGNGTAPRSTKKGGAAAGKSRATGHDRKAGGAAPNCPRPVG
jgi:hypothetical protein